MTLARPDLLALLALVPLAAGVATWLWRRRIAAAEEWAARGLWDRLLTGWAPRRIVLSVIVLALAVLGIALALARPRWGVSEQTVERQGVDLVFVLDASLSMGTRDVTPSRLEVAKTLVRRLVQAMPGNRVALIGAEGNGVILAPLTTDAAVVDLILDGLQPDSLPRPGTELGNALELVPRIFPPGSEHHRAAVLLSDGEDHGGGLGPRLDALADAGVVVHAIGVGTLDGATVPAAGPAGAAGQVKRRADGSKVISALDEPVLEQIARATGGVYLRATDSGRNLRPLIASIGAMETQPVETSTLDTHSERFQWPLALAAVALLLYLAVPPFRQTRQIRQVGRPRRAGAVDASSASGRVP